MDLQELKAKYSLPISYMEGENIVSSNRIAKIVMLVKKDIILYLGQNNL